MSEQDFTPSHTQLLLLEAWDVLSSGPQLQASSLKQGILSTGEISCVGDADNPCPTLAMRN